MYKKHRYTIVIFVKTKGSSYGAMRAHLKPLFEFDSIQATDVVADFVCHVCMYTCTSHILFIGCLREN